MPLLRCHDNAARGGGGGTGAAVLVLVAALTWAVPGGAAWRCGSKLIQEGDRKLDVVEQCGEPDFLDRYAGAYLEGAGPVDRVETWYYNRGPARLIRILTFHRGVLRQVETGDRGFNESAARHACDPHALGRGMSKYELLLRCGEPAARESWLQYVESPRDKRHGRRGLVRVEEWTYGFGSNRFRRYVRMVNGRVVDIELGDKGD